jgi:hypothetical protein
MVVNAPPLVCHGLGRYTIKKTVNMDGDFLKHFVGNPSG